MFKVKRERTWFGRESAKEWSPASERAPMGYKLSAESPPFVRINKKLGGSTENLIVPNLRPSHLHLPASSSGDSLDVEVREKEPAYSRSRKSRSMVAHKRSPVPAPRRVLPSTEVYERAPETQSASSVVDERLIKRTKYSESGKKSKKNWSECYMVLTHTALYFYKDQRTYNAAVNVVILRITNRYTRSFTLTVGYDTYLLQDESDDKAKQLLLLIQNIIYNLGPPTLEEYPPQYQSSNTDLESLGRTPPVARHVRHKKAGGSSNEDLSDSTEISTQKSQVTKVLRKFFPKRPTMEDLVKKGIYKGSNPI
ncbi:PREDICTED: rho GTPase-activating protein 15-like [Papilio polytes]|uniref:rho GTPase-activating protein 15-like n=1 Tax=Papilio polytes TaxID=76194 RepID=UPI000675DB38|nr:PREDICTED: rho GTPase-activating protein 15-like [Papilio polytes]